MPIQQIKNRWTQQVLFECEVESLEEAAKKAVAQGADLRGADLRGADLTDAVLRDAVLTGADLRGADLRGADLRGADLTDAVLTGAFLTDADLTGADLTDAVLRDAVLTGADLTDAVLRGADLTGAFLTGADLTGAVLRGADLTDAVLRGAVLTPVRDDLWAVLSSSPAEVEGLRAALAEGRVDGCVYHGECACLVGTLANVAHLNCDRLPVLKPNADRPAERWFVAIRPGHTAENSEIVRLTLEWVDLWLSLVRSAFAPSVADPASSAPATPIPGDEHVHDFRPGV